MKKTSFILMISILFTGFLLTVALPKNTLSETERRKLAAFPEVSIQNILDGEFFTELDAYLTDHFPFRDSLRQGKGLASRYVFQRSDEHDLYVWKNSAIKMEYPEDSRQIDGFISKTNKMISKYFPKQKVYFSIIPDKNYFAAKESGHLFINYPGIIEILKSKVNGSYIDIFPELALVDYYTTDTHWRQEKILSAASKLSQALGVPATDYSKWTRHEYTGFTGVYHSRTAPQLNAEKLFWLSSKATDAATVTHISEKTEKKPVYDETKLGSRDSYEMFLSGATPICTMENKLNKSGKKLLMFRDSFGSSMAPLLLGQYSEITLVDTRYVMPMLIPQLLDLTKYDKVLFLYSASLVNQSDTLKEVF